jgi:hypothetical protein
MMSSFLSAAPERAWMPMSKVPPSPAHATTQISSIPLFRYAALIPAAVEAAVSKAQLKKGTSMIDRGKAPGMIVQQQAGTVRVVGFPKPFNASLMEREAPQPAQAKFPEVRSSSSGISWLSNL